LVSHDCDAALQTVGLDPTVGFLHADRPGRPSLALDLSEEFRVVLADRLAIAMINLGLHERRHPQVRHRRVPEAKAGEHHPPVHG
jgi:CRISPR-associated protein Cas1